MFQVDNKYVGQMINEVREQRKLQQKDLADRIGVAPSVMSKIESGQQTAGIQTLVHISEELNVRLEYLLGMDRDIDDDEHMVNLFLKKFFKVITTQSFCKKKAVYTQKDIEDLFYAIPGDHIIFEAPQKIFAHIKQYATASSRKKFEQDAQTKQISNEHKKETGERVTGIFCCQKRKCKSWLRNMQRQRKQEKYWLKYWKIKMVGRKNPRRSGERRG